MEDGVKYICPMHPDVILDKQGSCPKCGMELIEVKTQKGKDEGDKMASMDHTEHHRKMAEDFRRYFDIGVFHAREPWMIDALGTAEGEGFRFMQSEVSHLIKNAPWFLPSALARAALKYAAYQLGKREKRLSQSRKRTLSMNRAFWTRD